MILRELLAVFGLDYDARGQKQAERGLQALRSQADTLAGAFSQVFAATAIASPFVYLTKLASDAQENLNLLQLAFGENSDAVVKWSEQVGPAIGRSRYTMRELAAEFGGLLAPMVGAGDQLAEMSTKLSELAVDLSSARNVSEKDALMAIQSGLSGNIIAMKRFGSNLSQARVQAEAFRRGLGKNTQALTQGQLAGIRYSLIMEDLAFIQGDAANTQKGFANSTRALRDQLKDIGTEIGFFFLPAFEESLWTIRQFLGPLVEMARGFRDWASDTNLAKGALLGLSVIVAGLLLPTLIKVVPLIAAFGAFALILDDVITTFEGGQSILGTFSKWMDSVETGLPSLGKAVLRFLLWPLNRLRDVIGAIGFLWYSLFEAIDTGSFEPLKNAAATLGGAAVDSAKGLIQGPANLLTSGNQALGNFLTSGSFDGAPSIPGAGGAPTVNQGDSIFNFSIQQQPGQGSDDLALQIGAEVEKALESRDRGLVMELVQIPTGG